MELWELAVREQVRDTLARYNHAGDRGQLEELSRCFMPDGVLEIKLLDGRREARGRAGIVTVLSGRADAGPPPHRFVRHHVTSIRLQNLTRERAEAAAYFVVYTAFGADHWGRYRDVLTPLDGEWLLAHRRVTVDAAAPWSYLR
jgi:hypothetical protein